MIERILVINSPLSVLNKLIIHMRRGERYRPSTPAHQRSNALGWSKQGAGAENRHRASLSQTPNDSDTHLAHNQAVLEVMAAMESGGSWMPTFAWLQGRLGCSWVLHASGAGPLTISADYRAGRESNGSLQLNWTRMAATDAEGSVR